MENNEQNKEKLLDYLEIIRDNQALKFPEEMNRELLDGTVSMLLKLQNKKVELSIEEIKERVRKIPFVKTPDFEGASHKTRKKINKRKILLIAAIIAILCTLLTIISSGYDFDDIHRVMRDKFGSVFNVPVGITQVNGDDVFINHGTADIYTNTMDFFKNEKYDVLMPGELSGGIKLIDIMIIERDKELIVSFDSCVTEFRVLLKNQLNPIIIDTADDIINVDGLLCYVKRLDDIGTIQINFEYNGNCYSIAGTDEQILLNIIENLEEKQ